MPLVNLSQSQINELRKTGQDIREVDRVDADWKIAKSGKEFYYGEPCGLHAPKMFPGATVGDVPSQTIGYVEPQGAFWLPCAGNSASVEANTVKLSDRGLCAVKVDIRHILHKYVRARKNNDTGVWHIVSDVFGQFPLYTYETKNDEEPTLGVQNGLIQLGTPSGSTIVKAVESIADDGSIAVGYCDALGNILNDDIIAENPMFINVIDAIEEEEEEEE